MNPRLETEHIELHREEREEEERETDRQLSQTFYCQSPYSTADTI